MQLAVAPACMQEAELPGKRHSLCEKVTALLVLAISLGVLAFGGILAANYTSANWLQLLYMTSPLLVALLARAVLGIPISPALWPALVLTLVGSGAQNMHLEPAPVLACTAAASQQCIPPAALKPCQR